MLISAKDLINRSIDLYKNKSEHLLPYVWLLLIPTGLTGLVQMWTEFNGEVFSITSIVLAIIFSIFSLWFTVVFIRVIAELFENRQPKGMKKELEEARHLIIPIIIASILSGLAVIAGLILFVIPGIIFAIWFAFVSQAVALDHKENGGALRMSKALVQGRWWAVFWRLLAPGFVFTIFIWIVQAIVGLPLGYLLGLFEPNSSLFILGSVLFVLAMALVAVLFVPLVTAAPTLLYLELKRTMSKKS